MAERYGQEKTPKTQILFALVGSMLPKPDFLGDPLRAQRNSVLERQRQESEVRRVEVDLIIAEALGDIAPPMPPARPVDTKQG